MKFPLKFQVEDKEKSCNSKPSDVQIVMLGNLLLSYSPCWTFTDEWLGHLFNFTINICVVQLQALPSQRCPAAHIWSVADFAPKTTAGRVINKGNVVIW